MTADLVDVGRLRVAAALRYCVPCEFDVCCGYVVNRFWVMVVSYLVLVLGYLQTAGELQDVPSC